MKPLARLVTILVGFVLLVNITPSWGGPPNPTASDANSNTAGGTGALENVVAGPGGGFNNTAFGRAALHSTTTGSQNTATGEGTLLNNTTGGNNTATGAGALLSNTIGGDNTATGFGALLSNTGGVQNTASGSGALQRNTFGNGNTACGAFALFSNTTGGSNTASGSSALHSNTTGSQNTATGLAALNSNATGNNNTASGVGALTSNAIGDNNTASGANALSHNTTGSDNTVTGVAALLQNSVGEKNTVLGAQALLQSTGNKNIAIGFKAGATLTSGNNNIYLGNPGNGDESKTMRLGSAQTSTFIAGVATAGVSGTTVEIDANGQLGVTLSSARYKRDIAAMGTHSEKVLQLRPVTFAYKGDAQGVTRYGLIAEEVATVYPELVTHTATGEVQAVRYQELIPMLLNELQRQRQEFQQALQRQQQELEDLRSLVGQGREGQALISSASVALKP